MVYDDFVVGAGGVDITGVFSNDLLTVQGAPLVSYSGDLITSANWVIEYGQSPGEYGIVAGYGSDAPATMTAAGISYDGYEFYTIEIKGFNVNLPGGQYWLAVSPDFSPESQFGSDILTTAGANGVGTPQAQDGNSFLNSIGAGKYLAVDPADGNQLDFSEGVIAASSSPEPGTAALGAGAVFLLGLMACKRKTTRQIAACPGAWHS